MGSHVIRKVLNMNVDGMKGLGRPKKKETIFTNVIKCFNIDKIMCRIILDIANVTKDKMKRS